MSLELSPTALDIIRSTFFGKDFDTYRQEIIDALTAIFGADVVSNIVASEQGVVLIEMNAYALSTLSWYGDRQADDTTLQFARLRFAAVTVARQLGYKATSSVPAVADVRVVLTTLPPVQLTILKGIKVSGPDGLSFETLADVVFDPGQIGSGLPTGLTVTEIIVDPSASNIVYLSSTAGIIKTITSGTTWEIFNAGITNTNLTSLIIDPVTPTTLYAGSITGGVFKTINSGVDWAASNSGLTNLKILALVIDPITPANIYLGTNASGLFKSINSGVTWSTINGGIGDFVIQTVAVDPATPTTLYAGTFSSGIYKSTNSGLSWALSNTGLTATNIVHIEIDPVTPATIYVATVGAGIFKSTDSGVTWAAFNTGHTGLSPNDIAIDPVTPTTLYSSTSDAGIFKSVNGGVSWTSAVVGLTQTVTTAIAVDGLVPANLYVGTADGGVFKSSDAALTWAIANNGIDDPIKTVQMREGQSLSAFFKSTGSAAQTYELSTPGNFTIAQDSPSVSVAGILWPEVKLLTYDQTDQVEIEYGLSPPRVIFGDGIAGNIPPKDAQIQVDYFVTSGTLGSIASNTIGNFTTPIVAGITPIGTLLFNTSPSTPGSDPETIGSIRINAPLVFQAAQRSVTSDDLTGWINSYVDPVFGAVSKGRAVSPRSGAADAEAQSIIASLIAFGAPASITTRLNNYIDSIVSSNCTANVVNAQILASDSIGRYVSAPAGLALNLATFLNTISESTVEAVVTDGSNNLLSIDVTIAIQIVATIVSDVLRNNIKDGVRDVVQVLLLGRDFGDSLRIGDIYQTVEAVEGIDYSNISIVVKNNIGDDISTTRLDKFGDVEIEEFEVITMGMTPLVEFI
jgi:photosystem II stability/assembly factor-like uncharacterized protein